MEEENKKWKLIWWSIDIKHPTKFEGSPHGITSEMLGLNVVL